MNRFHIQSKILQCTFIYLYNIATAIKQNFFFKYPLIKVLTTPYRVNFQIEISFENDISVQILIFMVQLICASLKICKNHRHLPPQKDSALLLIKKCLGPVHLLLVTDSIEKLINQLPKTQYMHDFLTFCSSISFSASFNFSWVDESITLIISGKAAKFCFT